MIDKYGLPDVSMIRRIFDNIEDARKWEHTVLRRLKVVNIDKWLNQTDNQSFPLCSGDTHWTYGKKGSDHPLYGQKQPKISQTRKEKRYWISTDNPMHNVEQKEKSIIARSGNNHHMKRDAVKEKVSGKNNWIYQKPGALEARQQQFREMNRARKGMKYKTTPCPFCDINMPNNNFKRHVKICERKSS